MTHRRLRRAFTLIEILVVIGILVLIAGITLPALVRVIRTGQSTKGAADLASVATALDAYKTDHGDYPRPTAPNTGFAALGRALIAPGGAGQTGPQFIGGKAYAAGDVASTGAPNTTGYAEWVFFAGPNAELKYEMNPPGTATPTPTAGPNWAQVQYSDGKSGPGLKVRPGAAQSFGPYLVPEKWRTRGLALLDSNDNPILYFPARPGKVVQAPPWALLRDSVNVATGAPPVFEASDNLCFFQRPNDPNAANAAQRMAALLISGGDFDGLVETNETAVPTGSFLLWAAGADGVFGAGKPDATAAPVANSDAIKNCDDITNFRQQ